MTVVLKPQPILEPKKNAAPVTAGQIASGAPIPPIKRLKLFSPDDWEEFINEWAYFSRLKRGLYLDVVRFSGAGDKGVDVAGFVDAKGFHGCWDGFQCKHYSDPLTPGIAKPEIAKILWFSFCGDFNVPRNYFFMAPHGIGTKLNAALKKPDALKQEILVSWDKDCRKAITSTQEIDLDGAFLSYVKAFDFSIFKAIQPSILIDEHRLYSPYHLAIFGGGITGTPLPAIPPTQIGADESVYVAELLRAYADHKKSAVSSHSDLKQWPSLNAHFNRQREAFYQAESLRVFVRDKVEPGTFERLQDEIFSGVIDTRDDAYEDGYRRVCAVTKAAQDMQLTANPVGPIAQVQHRHGICHQLANTDRLKWTD